MSTEADEAHHYKNRAVISSTRDLAREDESQRAMDLAVKLRVLREARENDGRTPHIVTFATGTPIPNSPREMWVMLDFLRSDLLRDAGVATFDAWVANHLRPQTRLEMRPTGAGFAPRTRITQFVNVPELSQMWRQMADLVTVDDLDVTLPTLTGGQRTTIALDRTAVQADYAQQLEQRAAKLRGGRSDVDNDNMLAISTDGRKAALDQRLVGYPAPEDGGRPTAVSREVLRIHRATADRVYLDDDGRPSPRRGGLQILFCDQSTPKPGQWNIYTQIRDELLDAGMPAEQIRFIHQATTGRERAELFAACRDGRVSVLIGSTAKLGTGANIQTRAVAEHHIDVPWRPADLEQREGRIIRQGNQNTQVEILAYVTRNSYDAFSWTVVAIKATTIAQIKNGTAARRVDANDYDHAGYEEIAATSSGDPRIMERYQLGSDLASMEALERAHLTEQRALAREIQTLTRAAGSLVAAADRLSPIAARLSPTAGDAFAMLLDGRRYTERADAGRTLFHLLAAHNPAPGKTRPVDQTVGALGGLDLRLSAEPGAEKLRLSFPAIAEAGGDVVDGQAAYVDAADAGHGATPGLGVIRRLENYLAGLPAVLADLRERAAAMPMRAEQARALLGTPFGEADRLAAVRARIAVLDAELSAPDRADLDPPPPRWLSDLDPDEAASLIWGPRLHRLHPAGAGHYADIDEGDVIAAATASGQPRRVTSASGSATRTIRWVELGTGRTGSSNHRDRTGIGIVAHHRDNLSPMDEAIVDAPAGARIVHGEDLTAGVTVTVLGYPLDGADRLGYPARPHTGTITTILGEHSYRPGRRMLLDTGERVLVPDEAQALIQPEPGRERRADTDGSPVTADTRSTDSRREQTSEPIAPGRSDAATLPAAAAGRPQAGAHPPTSQAAARRTDSAAPGSHAPLVHPRAENDLVTDDVATADLRAAVRPLADPAPHGERTPGSPAPPPGRPTPTGPPPGPTVLHGPGGTAVTGTDKTDTALREALKANGFAWSRRESLWYLRSTLPEHTRAMRVDRLRAAMASHGRDLPVADNPHRRPADVPPRSSAVEPSSTDAPIRSDRAPDSRSYEL